MIKYEYRSRRIENDDWDKENLEKTCNDWADEGWEVFSILCPNPRNYSTFQVTARRPVGIIKLPTVTRKFR